MLILAYCQERVFARRRIPPLRKERAVVPMAWFYEVGNGLLMAYRRKRITFDQIDGFLTRLKALPIDAAEQLLPNVAWGVNEAP